MTNTASYQFKSIYHLLNDFVPLLHIPCHFRIPMLVKCLERLKPWHNISRQYRFCIPNLYKWIIMLVTPFTFIPFHNSLFY